MSDLDIFTLIAGLGLLLHRKKSVDKIKALKSAFIKFG
jgi:hypothetical protein